METQTGYFTLKGYAANEENELTFAMEDYLEMICRLMRDNLVVRIGELAGHLHVKPSSASKMIQQLRSLGCIEAERYGYITLTEKGRKTGEYLLYRHETVKRFLCALNKTDNELEQAEKIEHFLNRTTVDNLRRLAERLERENEKDGGAVP